MQYILMLYVNEAGWPKLSKAEQEQGMAAYIAYTEALTKAGVLRSTNRLEPSSAATTVRAANGKPQVLDGPYTDSKEQLGGYYIIEVRRSRRRALLGGALPDHRPRRRRSAPDLVGAGLGQDTANPLDADRRRPSCGSSLSSTR